VTAPETGSRELAAVDPAIGEVLVTNEDLMRRIAALGAEISRDYEGRDLVMVGVLKGAVLFIADLMRHITVPCEIDFMAVSSYGSQTDSSGVVRILKDLDASIEGRDILIVEDIIDSGLTLHYLLRNLRARNPGSLEVCALLTKPERRRVDLPTRYVGFEPRLRRCAARGRGAVEPPARAANGLRPAAAGAVAVPESPWNAHSSLVRWAIRFRWKSLPCRTQRGQN
jgi:hypoxanthine phosphoribosyltransferase